MALPNTATPRLTDASTEHYPVGINPEVWNIYAQDPQDGCSVAGGDFRQVDGWFSRRVVGPGPYSTVGSIASVMDMLAYVA